MLSFLLLYAAVGYAFYRIAANQAHITQIQTIIRSIPGATGPPGPQGPPGSAPTGTPARSSPTQSAHSPAPPPAPQPLQRRQDGGSDALTAWHSDAPAVRERDLPLMLASLGWLAGLTLVCALLVAGAIVV